MKRFLIFTVLLAVAAAQLPAQNLLLPKYELTINGFGGLSTLNYKVKENHITDPAFKVGLGGGGGLGFHYFFNDNIGLVTGLEVALYRASFSASKIDVYNGSNANPYKLSDFKETQNYLALQLPVMAQWMKPVGTNHFYLGIGGKVGYGLLGNYKQSVKLSETLVVPSPKGTLKFAPFNAMASTEAGIRWKLSENMGLYTGIYFDYGFLNIIPDADHKPLYEPSPSTHNSILTSDYFEPVIIRAAVGGTTCYTKRVNTLAAGVKIKLAFGGPKKKSATEAAPRKSKPVKEVPQEIKQSMIRLSNTLFAFDKWNLTSEAVTELNKVVKWLIDNPDIKVRIEGHTDSMGSVEYNQKLSEDRTRSVYNYFVEHGVSASRLSYRGYGLTRPIADNSTAEGRQLNRRVELIIIQ